MKKDVLEQMEEKRRQLEEMLLKKSDVNSKELLELSREIDVLINEYYSARTPNEL